MANLGLDEGWHTAFRASERSRGFESRLGHNYTKIGYTKMVYLNLTR